MMAAQASFAKAAPARRPRNPRRPKVTPVLPPAPVWLPEGGPWFGILLPRPVSVNALYRNNKNRKPGQKGRVKTTRYSAWCNEAGWTLNAARASGNRAPSMLAAYELVLQVGRRKGSDIGNVEKAVADWLKDVGVIVDDSLCERLVIEWADSLPSNLCAMHLRAWTPAHAH
jgi:crossover junction endodeoxyribonuclease RusA